MSELTTPLLYYIYFTFDFQTQFPVLFDDFNSKKKTQKRNKSGIVKSGREREIGGGAGLGGGKESSVPKPLTFRCFVLSFSCF